MRAFIIGGVCAGAALIGAAFAAAAWTTVSLDGDPDFTIAIPADAAGDYKPSAEDRQAGTIMSFTTAGGGTSVMICDFVRIPYADGIDRKTVVERIKDNATLCTANADHDGEITVESNTETAAAGAPARQCLMHYNGSPPTLAFLPYSTQLNVGIAGRKSLFALACLTSAATPDQAAAAWRNIWSAKVSHMVESIHLPKDER